MIDSGGFIPSYTGPGETNWRDKQQRKRKNNIPVQLAPQLSDSTLDLLQ